MELSEYKLSPDLRLWNTWLFAHWNGISTISDVVGFHTVDQLHTLLPFWVCFQ